ncbi:MAG: hypothetical protein WCH57_01475 [Verrucomicrobiota bacterium]
MERYDTPSSPSFEPAPAVEKAVEPEGLPFIVRIGRRIEILISIALVLLTLVFMTPIFRGMATTSLGTDERGTVTRYSSKGPLKTITCYDLAKNHIFFNLLNSLTPGSRSLNSLRVRLWSFVFLGASGIAALLYFARRGWFFEGALWIYFWGVNPKLVSLNLMARGYGFLSFVTLALTILTIRYFETGDRKALRILCALTVLGVWTIPSFLIFGGSLLVFLLLATRRREVLVAGAATLAAVAILYAPVIRQVLHVMQGYGAKYGEDYATMEAVAGTLRDYLLPAGDNLLFALLCGALVAPFALWPREEPVGRGLRLLMGVVFVFFAACLTMKTPPLRTTALTICPLLFCLVHVFGRLFRHPRMAFVRPLAALAVSVPLLAHASYEIASYRFLPEENWLDVSRAIETIFPKGTTTYGGSNTILAYVQNRYRELNDFDKEAFLKGKSVVIHSHLNVTPKPEVPVSGLSPRVLDIQIPQRISGFQNLWFVPPAESGIAEVTAAGGTAETGWKLATPGMVALKLRPGTSFHSLNMLVKGGAALSQVQAEATVNGTKYRMETFQEEGGRVYSLRLPGQALTRAEIAFSSPTPGIAISVAAIWAYPVATEENR